MRKRTLSVGALAALVLFTASAVLGAPETFQFDKGHTLVGFRIRHFVSKVEGRFKDFDGVIVLDRQNPASSKVDLTIQAASIDTASENRDKDLRSANFFDVEKYPTLTFKSTKVTPKGGDNYEVTGDFTMHGVTKTITVPVRSGGFMKAGQGEKAGFETLNFTINRKDYGITWNRTLDAGAVMLGDDVEINIQVEANKKSDEAKPAAPAPAKPGS
ncbi:MAG: YceI family protein [Acidobacteriota bacterium]|nr:YceI family protein [Acidobacteriota bacterium]